MILRQYCYGYQLVNQWAQLAKFEITLKTRLSFHRQPIRVWPLLFLYCLRSQELLPSWTLSIITDSSLANAPGLLRPRLGAPRQDQRAWWRIYQYSSSTKSNILARHQVTNEGACNHRFSVNNCTSKWIPWKTLLEDFQESFQPTKSVLGPAELL